MQIDFAKYEGAGNDFILIDNRDGNFTEEAAVIARLCDRHFGIGADGLMTLSTEEKRVRMRYYNADGSRGEMCGNGARCFALFAEHLGLGGRTKRFVADDGEHEALLHYADRFRGEVEVAMVDVEAIEAGDGWWSLNTGVPHYVEFTDVDAVDVAGRGSAIRHDLRRFPAGTNVNFAEVAGEGALRMRTYERGVEAETLACGTGATAVAIVANLALQPACHDFRLTLPGGELRVSFSHEAGTQRYTSIRLSGPARRVAEGCFDTGNFTTHNRL